MPKLYTMPGTCSLGPNIAAMWIDAPVEVVTMKYGDHQKNDFLAINPKGKVPAVVMDDGDVLTELPAIMTWLGATYGGEDWARDTALGRKEEEALCWLSSEVHGDFGPHFAAQTYAESEGAQDEVKAAAYRKVEGHLDRIEAGLEGRDWMLGTRSFADAFLYVIERWADQVPGKLEGYPNMLAHRDRMQADDKVLAALERQEMTPV